jgi:hypothetical protein
MNLFVVRGSETFFICLALRKNSRQRRGRIAKENILDLRRMAEVGSAGTLCLKDVT